MLKRYQPINPKCQHLLHGGDYNPDQWISTPEIWDEDMRLMKLAHCNAMSIGIFAWSALEPAEGQFDFSWMDSTMDKLAENNAFAVLATPSGGKPAWMSRKYPEIRRVNADGTRQPHRSRHNHCRTSPVFREKCQIINRKLAERYKDHPALLMWHISNEYNGGDCHCDLCYEAFRDWLKERYDHDIDKLNHAWWTSFWSHTFPDWDYIEPVDSSIHGMMIDWERFKTHQTIDFYLNEIEPLRELTPDIPITTNLMPNHDTVDNWAFAKVLDVVSWDSYPFWHEKGDNVKEAAATGLVHDMARCMKGGKPFMLMESVPSIPTRGKIKKRKEPGMHALSSLQAVAHGSDTVQYFQWRKSRGGLEKFHGAVVDHVGNENTRVFREVAELGELMSRLDDVVGTTVSAEIALIHDFENEWALKTGGRIYLGENIKYREECTAHYQPLWQQGIPVDVIDQDVDLDAYKLVVIPMAYMLRPGFADKVKAFVEQGGTAVMTYWSAVVNESDLCLLGGIPGDGLREVFAVREEESQSYYPHESIDFSIAPDNHLGLAGNYKAVDTCSVIHAEGSEILATYDSEYFAGSPVLTCNSFGKGKAYYIAARTDSDFLHDFYSKLVDQMALKRVVDVELPKGVSATLRSDGTTDYIFLMNFNEVAQPLDLNGEFEDVLSGKSVSQLTLEKYAVRVFKRPAE